MAITVHSVEPGGALDEIIDFTQRNLDAKCTRARFDWLYLQNPFGPARVWIATEDTSRRNVGMAAAFPRQVWVDRKPCRGWVLGDFCVAAESRSLGPAVLLQRACLSSLANDGNCVWYDFPSHSMLAVYRRLGISVFSNHVRYVNVFRIDETIRRRISSRAFANTIIAVGNLMLRFHCLSTHGVRDEVFQHVGVFGEEFTSFDARTAGFYSVQGSRTAEYLNWRYLQQPVHRYCVIVAKIGGELLGYAILRVDTTDWTLVDLHTAEEATTTPRLLRCLNGLAKASNVERINASIMGDAPLGFHLRRSGFYPRESVPVVTGIEQLRSTSHRPAAEGWFLMQGDRES